MALNRGALVVLAALALAPRVAGQDGEPPWNVLFVTIDDLRPALGCYGDARARTPSLDALAARGVLFERAYVQIALCTPSRASVLTGRRPDTTGVLDLETHFRVRLPDVVTLPQLFREAGWLAAAVGKVHHADERDPPSWSVEHWEPFPGTRGVWHLEENVRRRERLLELARSRDPDVEAYRIKGPPLEVSDAPESEYPDARVCERALELLRELRDEPFFLAVGFYKPHLPFNVPRRWWDLYEDVELDAAARGFAPDGSIPELALLNPGELNQFDGAPARGRQVPDELARDLVRGYYACTSFVDAQVGRLIAELDALGLAGRTLVVVWGDHGFHLGEQGLWGKFTNFEVATRAPLIVVAPGRGRAGARCDALVELVDLYPTLAELAGLALPDGLEGTSFAPLFERPDLAWKDAAFSQFLRGPAHGSAMGRSVRTGSWRYTEWRAPDGELLASELYDETADPRERVNVVADPERAEIVAAHAERLAAGWRAARPAVDGR